MQPLDASFDETRPLTVDEAVVIAIRLHQSGQLAEAEKLYRGILEVAPDSPDALHYLGLLAHQQGRNDDAIASIEKSLAVAPDRADCYSNLGIVLQAQGRIDDAIAAYRRAIALNPAHANAHSNLGVLLRAAGKPAEAEESYRAAIRADPGHIDAYTNLGVLYTALKRNEEAVACFCKIITLRPKHKPARRLLALAHCTIGEVDKAVKILDEWLDEEPDNPIAQHLLAACTGRGVPARASDAYIAATFDSFAASFESKLASLSYRAPSLVLSMLRYLEVQPAKSLDVLDAGCGTGLCGPLFRPYARTLIGVDLSQAMLDQARAKNVYDTLVAGELTEYLRGHPQSFDVIVSADTLVYFGDLEAVIAAAADALRPGGHLIFTVERAMEDEGHAGYRLELHGRYSHRQSYVMGVLTRARLIPNITHAELRLESGVPVTGLVIGATKPAL
jgi:predicted TPR repeat methyltransferase